MTRCTTNKYVCIYLLILIVFIKNNRHTWSVVHDLKVTLTITNIAGVFYVSRTVRFNIHVDPTNPQRTVFFDSQFFCTFKMLNKTYVYYTNCISWVKSIWQNASNPIDYLQNCQDGFPYTNIVIFCLRSDIIHF